MLARRWLVVLKQHSESLISKRASGVTAPAGASADDYADLYWIPVGAGTTVQRGTLRAYEAIAACLQRRAPMALVHGGLVGKRAGSGFSLELMPAQRGPNVRNEVVGPVGMAFAGRIRLFRYQVCLLANEALPDQVWAVGPPIRLTCDPEAVAAIHDWSRRVPAYVWGRRRPGHPEMWTSDSALAWILVKAGILAEQVAIPNGCRAPGWAAGLADAGRGN